MIRNKPFKNNIPPQPPYDYIRAQLDLKGAKNGDTYYFNLDNNLNYLKNPNYTRFIKLTEQNIIGDVVVSTEPFIQIYETNNGPLFTIGGALNTNSPVVVPYAAPSGFGPKNPPQFSGESLRTNEMNSNPINYFGHSAAKFPYGEDNSGNPNTNTNYIFLGITIYSSDIPIGKVIIEKGIVNVILKVYLK